MFAATIAMALSTTAQLPLWNPAPAKGDWLLQNVKDKAGVFRTSNPNELVLANGLIARRFRIAPNVATVAMDNLVTGETLLRAVKPEATVTLNGKEFPVGGLTGQPNLAFLTEPWIDSLQSDPNAFRMVRFEVGKPVPRMEWGKTRRAAKAEWPPKGVALVFLYEPPPTAPKGLIVLVRYELYDGVPILLKRIGIVNEGSEPFRLNAFKAEVLGLVEPESVVDSYAGWREPNLTVTTDYT
ncbi:MAG TPA: hypothetical protein PLX06_13420, partial [Fimbriimonadaceae bacterium]|nr:hypothetical protein [Fimbriimonadaceae bacterium]